MSVLGQSEIEIDAQVRKLLDDFVKPSSESVAANGDSKLESPAVTTKVVDENLYRSFWEKSKMHPASVILSLERLTKATRDNLRLQTSITEGNLPTASLQLGYRLLIYYYSSKNSDNEKALNNCEYLFESYSQNALSLEDLCLVDKVLDGLKKNPGLYSLQWALDTNIAEYTKFRSVAIAVNKCLAAIANAPDLFKNANFELCISYDLYCEKLGRLPLSRFYILCRHGDLYAQSGSPEAINHYLKALEQLNLAAGSVNKFYLEYVAIYQKLAACRTSSKRQSNQDHCRAYHTLITRGPDNENVSYYLKACENAILGANEAVKNLGRFHTHNLLDSDRQRKQQKKLLESKLSRYKNALFYTLKLLFALPNYATVRNELDNYSALKFEILMPALQTDKLWVDIRSISQENLAMLRYAALYLFQEKNFYTTLEIMSFLTEQFQPDAPDAYDLKADDSATNPKVVQFAEAFITHWDENIPGLGQYRPAKARAEDLLNKHYYEKDKLSLAIARDSLKEKNLTPAYTLFENSKSKDIKIAIAKALMTYHHDYGFPQGNPRRFFYWLNELFQLDTDLPGKLQRVTGDPIRTQIKDMANKGIFNTYKHWEYHFGLEDLPAGKKVEHYKKLIDKDLAHAIMTEKLPAAKAPIKHDSIMSSSIDSKTTPSDANQRADEGWDDEDHIYEEQYTPSPENHSPLEVSSNPHGAYPGPVDYSNFYDRKGGAQNAIRSSMPEGNPSAPAGTTPAVAAPRPAG